MIKSYWKLNLESKVIDQGSDTLAVLMPGIGYTVDRPLLDYSKRLCVELGYDVLPIEYGFQIARVNLNIPEELTYVIEESNEILKESFNNRYKKIVFISKSIGTIVHSSICKGFSRCDVKHIYLTPVNETMKVGLEENSLVITGTCDPLINEETVKKIKTIKDVNVIEIKNADHSLNIKNDVISSISIMEKLVEIQKEFLL